MVFFTRLVGPFLALIVGIFGQFSPHQVSIRTLPTPMQALSLSTQVADTPTPTPTPGLSTPSTIPGERGIHVPILLWHYISINPNKADIGRNGLSTPPATFESQLVTLQGGGYTPISLDELAAAFSGGPLPPKPVVLTFDDGYEDFYLNAYPLLTKYQMKGTEFIPTGLIGTNPGFFMTWSQIEEMSHSPYVTFEAHSVHHYYLPSSSAATLMSEIADSKKMLEAHVGYRVNWFAYPYGAFNNQVVAAAQNAGYIGGITTLPGSWQYKSRFFYIPRYRAGTRTGESLLQLVR